MPKDFNKYLTASLRVYIFVLVCIFIMKLIGLDYFGLDYETIGKLDKAINYSPVNYMIQFAVLCFHMYLLAGITLNTKPKLIEIIAVTLLNTVACAIIFKFKLDQLYTIVSMLIFYFYFIIKKAKSKKIIIVIIINSILQVISNLTRNNNVFEFNLASSLILDIDYTIMLLIWREITKGGVNLCQLHGSSLQEKIHLKRLLKKLQRNLHSFKAKPKQERIAIVIYILLSTIWNSLTVVIILIVAKLNGTLIECIFIASSFWLSKHSFGKPFHLASMTKCFIISNISYYVLNRITTPLGISVFVPVLLGVGLSYATSKLVKKTYKALYKGMPKELFEETILKVTDKNSQKYKICYEFYINGKSDLSLSFKYNYSLAGIRKIKSRINDEIRRLQ